MFLLNMILGTSLANNLHYDWQWERYKNIDIEICPDSNITEEKVLEVIEYWDNRNVTLKINEIKKVNFCDMTKFNVIQVSGYRNNFDISKYHAVTDIEWHYYGKQTENTIYYIDRAHIQLPNESLSNNAVVLHEFGHALGLGHSEEDFIMKKRHND